MSAASTSASPEETTSFHSAVEDCLPCLTEMVGDGSGVGSSMEQRSEFFSACVEEMMRSKSQFSSDVEHEIAHSRVHWSKVPRHSEFSEDDDPEEDDDDHEDEEVTRENREVFAELMNDPQWRHHERGRFFLDWHSPALGRKIAEGGQVDIFEVVDHHATGNLDVLLKVFRRGSRLLDLIKQWPHGILTREVEGCIAFNKIMLDDGRFTFFLFRCWGDLRKLIDQAMQEKNNQGPPFPYEWKGETLLAEFIMWRIANQMSTLHKHGILHRDLKATNILLYVGTEGIKPVLADYECSIGVVGTGFWRAPEILLALKNRSVPDFTGKMDVYNFGMTCFEIVTSRLPFEGELEDCQESRDLVIEGQRPKLPSDLNGAWKFLIEICWNGNPIERPSFVMILQAFQVLSHLGILVR